MLRRGVADGVIRPDADLPLLNDMLVAPVLFRCVVRPEPLSDEQVERVVDTVLTGLRPG